jgi:hypothetical protein
VFHIVIIWNELGKDLPHVRFSVGGAILLEFRELGKVSFATLLHVFSLVTIPVNPFSVMFTTISQFPEPLLARSDRDCGLFERECRQEGFIDMSL